MHRSRFFLNACFTVALTALSTTHASARQQPAPPPPDSAGQQTAALTASEKSSEPKKPGAAAAPAPKKQDSSECKVCRWFELQTASLGLRYKFSQDSKGVVNSNQGGYQVALKGRFKFDREGRYSLHAGLFSGKSFVSYWNSTSLGTGDLVTNLYLRQLYFAAKPAEGVEVQFGGLYFNRGESTEITTYANTGYLTGQRVTVRRPKRLFFDEVSATYGYVGDTSRPDLFWRLRRLNKSNYHQFLVTKGFGKRAVVSADYTFQSGAETLRQAVKVNTKELRVLDSFRFENYQRVDVRPAYGFAAGGEKLLHRRLKLTGGYAHIDRYYGGLNADRFNKGRRLFAGADYQITPELSLSAFAARGVGNPFSISNRTRVDFAITYNPLKTLQRRGIF